jgi:hypothetical protein
LTGAAQDLWVLNGSSCRASLDGLQQVARHGANDAAGTESHGDLGTVGAPVEANDPSLGACFQGFPALRQPDTLTTLASIGL